MLSNWNSVEHLAKPSHFFSPIYKFTGKPLVDITKALSNFYVFIVGWTGVFVFLEWLILPVLVLLLLTMSYLLTIVWRNPNISYDLYRKEDAFLGVMLLLWLTSAIINPNPKSFQYVGMYLVVFGLGFYLLKAIVYSCGDIHEMLRANVYGLIVMSLFTISDLVLWHSISVDIQVYIPRIKEAAALVGGVVRRSYGLAEEPTVLAYYFNVLAPLGLWYVWRSSVRSVIWPTLFSVMVLVAWASTFSIAGLVFLTVAGMTILALRAAVIATSARLQQGANRSTALPYVALILLVLAVTYLSVNRNEHVQSASVVTEIARPLIQKATFADSRSASQRLDRWQLSIDHARRSPFLGAGPGYFSALDQPSSINWYLFLGAEAGLPAAISAVLFLSLALWSVAIAGGALRWPVLIGGLAGVLHFGVIATVQHPALWTLLALGHVDAVRTRELRKTGTREVSNRSLQY